jgi:hypothetical protein
MRFFFVLATVVMMATGMSIHQPNIGPRGNGLLLPKKTSADMRKPTRTSPVSVVTSVATAAICKDAKSAKT